MPAFSVDELAAQALAGQSSPGTGIRAFMPDQHREFFSRLSYLFVGGADEEGWPVASVLWGPPGFVTSPNSATLRIGALPASDDPLAQGVCHEAQIGLLGLDLSNRRRNRANGRIVSMDRDGIAVGISQSFGNCAQYIQTRFASSRPPNPEPARALGSLDEEACGLIARTDTFFVASRSRAEIANGGFDVSHRGGRPGFIGIEQDTLVIPEFPGNRFFNTLGNLLGDNRAGLLFVDFSNGDVLQLQGRVTIDWKSSEGAPAGTLRVWRCHIERGWRRTRALPFNWEFGESAPTTLSTGIWKTTVSTAS